MQGFFNLGLNSRSLCLYNMGKNSGTCRKFGNVAKFVVTQHGLKNCKILYYYLNKLKNDLMNFGSCKQN